MDKNTLNKEFYNICKFDSKSSSKIKSKLIKEADDYLSSFQPNIALDEKKLEISLLETGKDTNLLTPILCLRCRVSNLIKKRYFLEIKRILSSTNINIQQINSLKEEILPFCLQDNGSKRLKLVSINDPKVFEYKPLIWEEIIKIGKKNTLPFGINLLKDFDSKRSSLVNWVFMKFRSSKEIKEIYNEYNIYSQTDWSYLSLISLSFLNDVWEFNFNANLPADIKDLLNSYQLKYKQSKKIYKNKYNRTYGWEPNENFLKDLSPPQENVDLLRKIAKLCRQYKKNNIKDKSNSAEQDILENIIESDDYKVKIFIRKLLIKLTRNEAIKFMNLKFKLEKEKWSKDKLKKSAWELYAKGFTQRGIAREIKVRKQAWVCKTIQEKSLSKQLALYVAKSLESKLDKIYKNFNQYEIDSQNINRELLLDELKNINKKFKDDNKDINLFDRKIGYISSLFLSNFEGKNFIQEIVYEVLF